MTGYTPEIPLKYFCFIYIGMVWERERTTRLVKNVTCKGGKMRHMVYEDYKSEVERM